jgi:uncharacterized membrane protein
VANQNQRTKSAAQTARKGGSSRGGQAARSATASRAPGAGRGGGSGSGPAARRPAAGGAQADSPPVADAAGWTPRSVRIIALALSIIGTGLSVYLTIAHLKGASVLICSNKGLINCEAVTQSPESKLFGVFPVAELGLAFYVFMTLMNTPWAWRPSWTWLKASPDRQRQLGLLAWRARLASVVLGILFILYLIYTELITLRNICLWCTYVHITTFLLFVLLLTQATFWGDPRKAFVTKRSPR